MECGGSREERIQYPLTCEKRVICGLLLRDWSWSSNGPKLHQGVLGGLSFELGFNDNVLVK